MATANSENRITLRSHICRYTFCSAKEIWSFSVFLTPCDIKTASRPHRASSTDCSEMQNFVRL